MQDAASLVSQVSLNFEERFALLARLMPNGVVTTNAEGIINFYNDKAAEIWGCKPMINDPFERRFCGALKLFEAANLQLSHQESPLAEALRSQKKITNRELIIERPDGTRKTILVNVDLIYGNSGSVEGAMNIFEDITLKKLNEDAGLRLAAIITSSEDAIISKTLDGTIRSWNTAAERLFGYQASEIIGRHITTLIPPEMHSDEKMIIQKLTKGEIIAHFETTRLRKDGTYVEISLTVSPIKDENGKIIGASKIARDISSQIKIQNQLKEYTQQLEQLNRSKDDFIGMASHELKTPLTSIKANLQILERKLNDDPNKEFVSKTLKHISKLNALVSDLLDVSKIQAGKLQLNKLNFDINELIEECIETVKPLSPSHKIIYTTSTEPVNLFADRDRLEQVIINLLTNAVKYSPNASEVLITAQQEGDKVLVGIRDFGIGISPNNIDKVFDRFYRVEGMDVHFSGLGIGLFIAYEIIKRHEGEMWVESELSKGSTFYFRL